MLALVISETLLVLTVPIGQRLLFLPDFQFILGSLIRVMSLAHYQSRLGNPPSAEHGAFPVFELVPR
jgi:hypothetical protein